jgi:uncharacterized protein YdaU (DUF1376 family)
MHYYQFNIGDYASATAHLEPLEDLAYRRLLDLYYSSEQPISQDLKQVGRLIRMRSHSEFIASVLEEFFTLEDDGWHCERVDVEIFKYTEKSHKASKSAKARWKKAKKKQQDKIACERIANAEETQSEGNANQEPLTINQEPLTSSKDIAPRKAKASRKIDDSPIMAYMPLTGDKQYELRQSQTDKWAELYPGVNLQAEVSKMIGWLDANPTKRKTSRGILKFMNNWLSRAQDNGKQYQATHQPEQLTQEQVNNFMSETEEVFLRSQAAKQRIAERTNK